MNCPVCQSPLQRSSDTRVYETLIDHVELRVPYPRHYYTCTNAQCESHKYGTYWDDHGDAYFSAAYADSFAADAYGFYIAHNRLRADKDANDRPPG